MKIEPPPTKPSDEMELMRTLWSPMIRDSLYNFVMFAYPWGQPNTPLAKLKGPRRWQVEDLKEIDAHIAANRRREAMELIAEIFRKATVSGRGVGKSAECSWLIHWMMSCHIGSTTIVTANTESQLKTKTWAELSKWVTMSINAHWWDLQTLSMRPMPWFEELLKRQLKIDTKYYYAVGQLWSEEKPDAFAGVHNQYGLLVIFDEASGIPAPIWTVTKGFFTEPTLHRYWLCFSNGRRNTGAFFECFHKNRDLWRVRHLDARTVEGMDHEALNAIIREYGMDSDEARVEVLGQFPAQGDRQFISRGLINASIQRELQNDDYAPLIMGLDPARFGNSAAVVRFRRGRDARTIPPQRYKGLDNMQLAAKCAELIDTYKPDAVCIDAGNGAGIIDRLRSQGYRVHEIHFGGKADDPRWANKRIELWGRMREWLPEGCLPADARLADDLAGPEYGFRGQTDIQILEPKEKMLDRGLASPDDGDALACTFAVRVARLDNKLRRNRVPKQADGIDFDPLADRSQRRPRSPDMRPRVFGR